MQIKIVEWDQVLDEKHRATHPFKQLPWFEIPELNLTFTETRVALKCQYTLPIPPPYCPLFRQQSADGFRLGTEDRLKARSPRYGRRSNSKIRRSVFLGIEQFRI